MHSYIETAAGGYRIVLTFPYEVNLYGKLSAPTKEYIFPKIATLRLVELQLAWVLKNKGLFLIYFMSTELEALKALVVDSEEVARKAYAAEIADAQVFHAEREG